MNNTSTISRTQALVFLALCLMSASAWLLDQAFPTALPSNPSQALHALIVAAVLSPWKLFHRRNPRPSTSTVLKLILASLCLFVLPSALAVAVSASVSQITLAALFTLVPAAVIVAASYFDLPSTNRLLAPAILGLAGALLLLPFTQPATLRQAALDALAFAAVVIVALASIWLNRLLASITLLDAALVCSLTTTVAFAALYLTNRTPWIVSPQLLTTEVLKSLAFDLPQLLLLLWLFRELPPTRLAARYLVVPLLTVFEGFVLLRPEFTLRAFSGAALLAFGAWRLLTAHEPEEEPRLSLK